jgi:hypothetical protein
MSVCVYLCVLFMKFTRRTHDFGVGMFIQQPLSTCPNASYSRPAVGNLVITAGRIGYGRRAGLRVCGTLGQCSVRGPRALKNVVGCGCVLDALLFM